MPIAVSNPEKVGRIYRAINGEMPAVSVDALLAANRLDEATLQVALGSARYCVELSNASRVAGSVYARIVWVRAYVDLVGPKGLIKQHKLINLALGVAKVGGGRQTAEDLQLMGKASGVVQALRDGRHDLAKVARVLQSLVD